MNLVLTPVGQKDLYRPGTITSSNNSEERMFDGGSCGRMGLAISTQGGNFMNVETCPEKMRIIPRS